MNFRILGPLEISTGNRVLTPSAAKHRVVLAALLVHASHVVSVDQLIDYLWSDQPPRSATNLVQGYVSELRRALRPLADERGVDELLATRSPGYLLKVGERQLDLHTFERLVAEARAARAQCLLDQAAERLGDALALWRGPALAGISSERLQETEASWLDESRVAALDEHIDLQLLLGRHVRLVCQLKALVTAYPLRERFRGQLMCALYGSGRRAEALQVYRDVRQVLVDEFGIEPGPELQSLQRAILVADPSLDRTGRILPSKPSRKRQSRSIVKRRSRRRISGTHLQR